MCLVGCLEPSQQHTSAKGTAPSEYTTPEGVKYGFGPLVRLEPSDPRDKVVYGLFLSQHTILTTAHPFAFALSDNRYRKFRIRFSLTATSDLGSNGQEALVNYSFGPSADSGSLPREPMVALANEDFASERMFEMLDVPANKRAEQSMMGATLMTYARGSFGHAAFQGRYGSLNVSISSVAFSEPSSVEEVSYQPGERTGSASAKVFVHPRFDRERLSSQSASEASTVALIKLAEGSLDNVAIRSESLPDTPLQPEQGGSLLGFGYAPQRTSSGPGGYFGELRLGPFQVTSTAGSSAEERPSATDFFAGIGGELAARYAAPGPAMLGTPIWQNRPADCTTKNAAGALDDEPEPVGLVIGTERFAVVGRQDEGRYEYRVQALGALGEWLETLETEGE